MNIKRNRSVPILFFPLIFLSLCVFTSCLDLGKLNVYLTLDSDDLYAGHARLEFIDIHSTSATLDEQKKEMNDIFAEYKKEADNIVKVIPLFNYTAELRNKKELSADVIIQGEFKNILAVLGSLICESSFHIEGNRKKLSIMWKNPLTDNTDTSLIIQYPGKIVSHNSKNFDTKTGTMRWNMSKTGDKKINFILESGQNKD